MLFGHIAPPNPSHYLPPAIFVKLLTLGLGARFSNPSREPRRVRSHSRRELESSPSCHKTDEHRLAAHPPTLSKVRASLDAFVNSTVSRRPTEDAMLNRSISTFLIGISFLPSAAKLALVLRLGATLARSRHGQKIPLPSPNCCR